MKTTQWQICKDTSKKSGKHKFAFAWNLRGGVPTQGHRRSRKEIPLLEAAHIDERLATTWIEPVVLVALQCVTQTSMSVR